MTDTFFLNGVETVFHYEGDHVWREEAASRTTHFLFSGNIDDIVARNRSDSDLAFYLKDRLGSVSVITDNVGNVISQTDYSAYGVVINQTNSSELDQYTFTGRELDSETGLYYYRARYYDAGLGRFVGEDPISFGDNNIVSTTRGYTDIALYRYVFNSPLNYRDAYGLSATVDTSTLNQLIAGSGLGALAGGYGGYRATINCDIEVQITAIAAGAGFGALGGYFGAALSLSFAPGVSALSSGFSAVGTGTVAFTFTAGGIDVTSVAAEDCE